MAIMLLPVAHGDALDCINLPRLHLVMGVLHIAGMVLITL